MKAGSLARRYARALFELAEENAELDKMTRDLRSLAESWEASDELREVFENPAIASDQRRQILGGVADSLSVSSTVKHGLMLLSDRRRLRHLPEVVEAFENLAEQKAGRVRAEVVTAGEMPDEYFTQLQNTLESVTGKQVVLVKKQDPSLIAGVVTRVGDRVFDGSLKTRLEELKEDLLTQPSTAT